MRWTWPEARAAEALRGAFAGVERAAPGAAAEVLLKVSRGSAARVSRGSPNEDTEWREDAMAVRVDLATGGGSLLAAPSWDLAEDLARRAVEAARGHATSPRPPAWPLARRDSSPCAEVPRSPPSPRELHQRLEDLGRHALGADVRLVALDSAFARSAVVDSVLARSAGHVGHQRQSAAQVHATVLARDGLRVASRSEAWAGADLAPSECERLGRRLAAGALLELTGLATAPEGTPLLLRPSALAELTFALAPALVGLTPSGAVDQAVAMPPVAPVALRLLEDSALDGSRVVACDGVGRRLDVLPVLEGGILAPPHAHELPRVRPGAADLPRPGWIRLTWGWSPGGEDEEALVGALGSGLVIDSATTLAVDPVALAWRGSASGTWVGEGRRRAFARVPLSLRLPELLASARAGSAVPESCHPSGTIRSIALLCIP